MDSASLIRSARQRAGLSQRALADRAGTSGPAVSMYETGERIPRVDTLIRLIDATGAKVHLAIEHDGGAVDVQTNGRALELVLSLADHLPRRSADDLDYPILRDHAR